MTIAVNPKLNYSNNIAFKNIEKPDSNSHEKAQNLVSTRASQAIRETHPQAYPQPYGQPTYSTPYKEQHSGVKGAVANTAYAWVNVTEALKGLLKGTIYGFLTGTAVAGFDMIKSGTKKYKQGQIHFSELWNRKKAMSKTGKVLSFVAAGIVFVGHLINAKLKINKRTANVDHMLYSGHRDK